MAFQFDATAEIVNRVRVAAVGMADVAVRFPGDDVWAERHRKTKVTVKDLGRGITETKIDYGDIDLKIYEQIKLNGSPPLTPLEATQCMNVIGACNATAVMLSGDRAEVALKVCGGTVHHTVRQPTVDEVQKLNDQSSRQFRHPYGAVEHRIYLEPGTKLYDACGGASGDYVGGIIPAIHKDTVIRAVIKEADRMLEPLDDEPDF